MHDIKCYKNCATVAQSLIPTLLLPFRVLGPIGPVNMAYHVPDDTFLPSWGSGMRPREPVDPQEESFTGFQI